MRILHVIASLAPSYGGPPEACLKLCQELARRGEEVAIYTTDADVGGRLAVALDQPIKVDGVEIRYFPSQWPRYYNVSLPLAKALSRDIPSFDIVHIHSLYLFHATIAAVLCRKYGVPYVIKPHGTLDPYLRSRHRLRKWLHERLFERHALAHAAAIQFTAEEEMILAARSGVFRKEKWDVHHAVVIPNGVVVTEGFSDANAPSARATRQLADLYPELRGKRIILFMGRLDFKKGLDLLVKAFAIVSKRHPDAQLVIAGPDNNRYGRRVRRWLKADKLLDRATFTGMLLGAEKAAALRSAELFVLPSYSENFGIAIVEAMNAGVPVVISNRVNIWREIVEGGAGLVVDCDAQELARALSSLLDDPAIRPWMGRCGRQLVAQRFTWEIAGSQALKVYRDILAGRGPSRPAAGAMV